MKRFTKRELYNVCVGLGVFGENVPKCKEFEYVGYKFSVWLDCLSYHVFANGKKCIRVDYFYVGTDGTRYKVKEHLYVDNGNGFEFYSGYNYVDKCKVVL